MLPPADRATYIQIVRVLQPRIQPSSLLILRNRERHWEYLLNNCMLSSPISLSLHTLCHRCKTTEYTTAVHNILLRLRRRLPREK